MIAGVLTRKRSESPKPENRTTGDVLRSAVVLVGSVDGRDFTGGEAATLWHSAVSSGAQIATDLDSAFHRLDCL